MIQQKKISKISNKLFEVRGKMSKRIPGTVIYKKKLNIGEV